MSRRTLWGTETPDYSRATHFWTRQKDGTFESLCQLRVRSKHEIGEPSWQHTCDCLALSEKQKAQEAKT